MKLITTEKRRYARHLSLQEVGLEGQERLKAAKVLVVGAGGLGCPVLLYLTAAGVGHIGIVDGDVVDESNLQRQVLYTMEDIGKLKAEAAKKRLEALNPHIAVTAYPFAFTRENALEMVENYDIIADGTDNFATRYLVNDACVLTGKINVYASIHRFEGQVAVFNFPNADGTHGPNYRDLFPTPPLPGAVLNCEQEGVLGVLGGIIGSMQANEIIKIITKVGTSLAGKLALFDAAHFAMQVIQLQPVSNAEILELIDYEVFCNEIPSLDKKAITIRQLQQMIMENIDFQLIDVRQPHEHEAFNLGGISIPLADIEAVTPFIANNKKVILYCQSGNRSAKALDILSKRGVTADVYHLEGGIQAWLRAFQPM